MRILHVIHSVNPVGGGPIEAVWQQSVVHQKEGHAVEVVSLDAPSEPWLANSRLVVHALGPSSRGYGFTTRLVPWLRAHRREYDVVVVNGIWQYSSFGVWRALEESGTPYLVFVHGMLDPWFKKRHPLKHLKKLLYWWVAERCVLRDAKAVLFTCEEERLLARQSFPFYRCKEVVINFGTADPTGDPVKQRESFLEKFPELRGKRVVLFLGRIHEKKGCQELIEAWRRAMAEPGRDAGDLWLVMAGPAESEYGQRLRRCSENVRLKEKILWTGMLTGELKWGAFRAAEAFILPSHQENFGIAVAEALACSVPVLISNKVNIWREIEAAGAGLIESDDMAGALQLLNRWLALDASQRQRLRLAAAACFAERFEIAKAGRHLLAIFKSVLDPRAVSADHQLQKSHVPSAEKLCPPA